jgi:hypothetical protein
MSMDAVRFLQATFTPDHPMSIGERVDLYDRMSVKDQELVRDALLQVMNKHTEELETKIVLFNEQTS